MSQLSTRIVVAGGVAVGALGRLARRGPRRQTNEGETPFLELLDPVEHERLRQRAARLEPIAAERDLLRRRVAELEAQVRAFSNAWDRPLNRADARGDPALR